MIGVLVSGSGTNLQALIDDGLPIAAVASNVDGVLALERAEVAAIPHAVFVLDDYPGRHDRDLAMAAWLDRHGVKLVVCAGYMHLLTDAFLAHFPAASSTSTRRCCRPFPELARWGPRSPPASPRRA